MPISVITDEKGNVHFPREFGIKPKEKLYVDKIDDMIVVKKAKGEIRNVKEAGDEIVKILKDNMKNVGWGDVEKAREDKEREW